MPKTSPAESSWHDRLIQAAGHNSSALEGLAEEVQLLQAQSEDTQQRFIAMCDEIAVLCGCPHWDYPGRIIRDVRALVAERDALQEQEPLPVLSPCDAFLRQGMLFVAGRSVYADGTENPFSQWEPSWDRVDELWSALSESEKQEANRRLKFMEEGGAFDLPRGAGDSDLRRVVLPEIRSDDWRYYLRVSVLCKVCRQFIAFMEDLPAECHTCNRTLHAENMKRIKGPTQEPSD